MSLAVAPEVSSTMAGSRFMPQRTRLVQFLQFLHRMKRISCIFPQISPT